MVKAFTLAAALLSVLLVGRAVAAPNDTRVQLAATADFVVVARPTEVRVHDGAGRWLFTLSPQDEADDEGDPRAGAAAARGEQALARERAFDALGVPEEARDEPGALDLVEEELPGRALRDRPRGRDGGHTRVLLASNGHALVVASARTLWRLEPGQPPRRLGPAPAGAAALGLDGIGRLYLARAGEILAGDAAALRVIHRPTFPVHQLVVDPGGGFVGLRGPDQIEVVPLAGGSGPVAVRVVGRPRDLAVCGGRLFALGDAGVAVIGGPPASLATARTPALLTGPTDAEALACDADGRGPLLRYGPGLEVAPTATAPASWPVPTPAAVEGAAVAGDHVWVYGGGFGLAELQPDPAGQGPPTLVVLSPDLDTAWTTAGEGAPLVPSSLSSPFSAPRRNRGLLPAFLPFVSLTLRGRESLNPGRHDLALGVAAEWRLPPPRVRPLPPPRPGPGEPLPVAFAAVQAAQTAPTGQATDLGGGEPGLVALPGPDPDAACLVRTRARAVALALVEPERARSLVNRAANAAWLPELRLRAERRVGRSESLDYKPTATSDALGLDSVDDVRYEVRATWDLPRLVFSPEELGAAQQASRIAEMRREIEAQVNRLYFERRRLLAAPGGQTPREDLSTWQLRLEEIEADLDALSAGGFTRCRQTPAPTSGDRP